MTVANSLQNDPDAAPPAMAAFTPVLRAVAEAFVPEIAAARPERWAQVERTVRDTLASRPPAIRRQVGLLLRLLELLSLAREGRRLATLDLPSRTRFLARLADSRLLIVRRGIWGLRTLVMLGWYGQPEVAAAIGYRASRDGWDARRE